MNKQFIFLSICIAFCAGISIFCYWRFKKSLLKNIQAYPQHLGIIMDGNRRWARKQGFKPWIGHKKGVEPVKETIAFCIEHHIPYLTLYAFSLENFNRPPEELHYLFEVLAQEISSTEFKQLAEKGVHISFIGDRSLFPAQLTPLIEDIEQQTAHNTRLYLTILFCYGGQQEIVAATKKAVQEVQAGRLSLETLNEKNFSSLLWSHMTPPPDLIIRTGGMKRLSNFLLYQSAYSEFIFLDCYWPELSRNHLESALYEFNQRQRNFGA